MDEVVELLAYERPRFQLQSDTTELRSSEALFSNGRADTDGLARANFGIGDSEAKYLAATLRPTWTTLETGGGASTVLFASKVRRHICVNPDVTANRLIREFLAAHDLPTGAVEFVEDSSDRALPGLDLGELDAAFIDGSHSFPFPIVDWHYIDPHLKIGGLLLVDDARLNAVRMLCDFLDLEAAYRRLPAVGDCAVFEKVAERTMGWGAQEINRRVFVGYRPLGMPYVLDLVRRLRHQWSIFQ